MKFRPHSKVKLKKPLSITLTMIGSVFLLIAILNPDFPVNASPYEVVEPMMMTPVVPVVPVVPTPRVDPPVVVPSDVESPLLSFPGNAPTNPDFTQFSSPALQGIQVIDDSSFPRQADLKGPATGISIKKTEGTVY